MFITLRKLVEWWQRQARSMMGLTFRRVRALLPGSWARQAKGRLIRVLQLAASYNDKDIYWCNHSSAQVRQTRQEWQQEIDILLAEIGESNLPAELRAALRSGAAAGDDSGRFVEQARRWAPTDR